MAWTAPRTWTAGETVTKAIMDTHVRDNELFLKTAHGCKVYSSSATIGTLTSGVQTAVLFNSEAWDSDGYHSTSTNTDRITVPTGMGGVYIFLGQGVFGANATGRRFCRVLKNGATTLTLNAEEAGGVSGPSYFTFAGAGVLAAGDYVVLAVTQDSGGGLALTGGDEGATSLTAILIGS